VIGERRGEKFLSILGRVLPLPNSDKEDSILAAEVAGVRELLKQLEPRTTRVGVVAFSGDNDALTPDAYTEVPLTTDYAKAEAGLDDIFRRGPKGLTNMVSAVNLATTELLGTQARTAPNARAPSVIMFLTDGQPRCRSRTRSCRTRRWRSSRPCAQRSSTCASTHLRSARTRSPSPWSWSRWRASRAACSRP
jgi:Mg-chelatase subunit ChlD